jgi:hypothetical protein
LSSALRLLAQRICIATGMFQHGEALNRTDISNNNWLYCRWKSPRSIGNGSISRKGYPFPSKNMTSLSLPECYLSLYAWTAESSSGLDDEPSDWPARHDDDTACGNGATGLVPDSFRLN